jgi:hypothetical protein
VSAKSHLVLNCQGSGLLKLLQARLGSSSQRLKLTDQLLLQQQAKAAGASTT